jgi:hypothetical protein
MAPMMDEAHSRTIPTLFRGNPLTNAPATLNSMVTKITRGSFPGIISLPGLPKTERLVGKGRAIG